MIAITRKNAFQEDVSTLAAGSTIVGLPCVVYAMTFTKEADGDPIISVSDSVGYDSDYRVEKVVLTAEKHTVQLTFPGGKLFTRGVSATSNLASVDMSVTYE